MRYAKLNDQTMIYAPSVVRWHGKTVINPSGEKLEEMGWKPVQYSDQPEPQGVGWFVETWTETEDAIVQGWVWHEASDEDEISDAEALDLLLGGAEA